jgi:hypothetical protein
MDVAKVGKRSAEVETNRLLAIVAQPPGQVVGLFPTDLEPELLVPGRFGVSDQVVRDTAVGDEKVR